MYADLKNDILTARIYTAGAELKSLAKDGKEYLWQGSEDSWKDSSPQLFPVIGSMIEGGWVWKGQTINLGNHGFARRSVFEVMKKDDTEVSLRIRDTDETREVYPFSFVLDIDYRLDGNTLTVSYRVENPADEDLLFSLGAHPGFNCPLEDEQNFSDWYLEFNRKESADRRLKEDFLTGETEPCLKDQDRIDLDFGLFDRGALIFSGLKSDSVILKSDKSRRSVRMDFAGFPDFGIWTLAGAKAPYVCLEPWYGVDSTVGDAPDFGKKEGLVRLPGGGEFSCSYTLTLE